MDVWFWCPGIFPLLLMLLCSAGASKDEQRLIRTLTKNYNPEIRPVKWMNESTEVAFEAEMIQLISMKERDQMMKTNMWLRLYWNDPQLVWNPEEYGGIEVLRIPNPDIWNPDIVLLNNADGNFEVSFSCKVLVYYYGIILWVPCSIYESSCSIDVKYFPFDEQVCEMIFGSWSYNAHEMKFKWYDWGETKCEAGQDLCYSPLDGYVISGTWDVLKAPGNIYSDGYGENKRTYISYYYTLRRKTTYFVINLVIPCIIISSLSLFGFYMPADACEKITLTITVLLSMMVFLLLVANILPDSSDGVPLISKYLLFVFFVNTAQVLISVLCTNFNMRTPAHNLMPDWMNRFFLETLPPLIGVVRPDDPTPGDREDQGHYGGAKDRKESRDVSKKMSTGTATPSTDAGVDWNNIDWESLSLSKLNLIHRRGRHMLSQDSEDADGFDSSTTASTPTQTPLYPIEVHQVAEQVSYWAKSARGNANANNVIEDWRFLALVFDRLLLWVFIIITIIGTCAILLNSPYLGDSIDQEKIRANWHDLHLDLMKKPGYIPSR